MDEIFEANENQNIIMSKTHKRIQRFTNGAGWLPAIEMLEGEELEIVVEFNWARSGVTRDWSLVAWGE